MKIKSHLPEDYRRDTTGPERARQNGSAWGNTSRGSAAESANTKASAKRDASLGVEATLIDREPHDSLPKSRRDSPAPEATPVERVLRRARAPAPAPRGTRA